MKKLIIDNKEYKSRLILGTGKYKNFEETGKAVEASGCEMVTVAIRRLNIGQDKDSPSLLDVVSPEKFTILPNTAGCYTCEDAVRTCELSSELLAGKMLVKLEVLSDSKTLYPNVVETLKASEILVNKSTCLNIFVSGSLVSPGFSGSWMV